MLHTMYDLNIYENRGILLPTGVWGGGGVRCIVGAGVLGALQNSECCLCCMHVIKLVHSNTDQEYVCSGARLEAPACSPAPHNEYT